MTGWMLWVVPYIHKYLRVHSNVEHIKQVNIFIKTFFIDYLNIKSRKLLTKFGLSIMHLIIIMAALTVMTLFGEEKTLKIKTFTYGISIILYHV